MEQTKSDSYSSITSDRHKYIGGSDIPAICETFIDAKCCKYHLALRKIERVESEDLSENAYVQFGNNNEDAVLEKVNEHFNLKAVKTDNVIVKKDNLKHYDFRANIDGYDKDKSTIVEVKCRLFPRLKISDILQATFYAICTGATNVIIATAKMHQDNSVGSVTCYSFSPTETLKTLILNDIEGFDFVTEKILNKEPLTREEAIIHHVVKFDRLKYVVYSISLFNEIENLDIKEEYIEDSALSLDIFEGR